MLLPPALQIGSRNETELLPATVVELDRLGTATTRSRCRRRVPDHSTTELLAGRVQQLHIAGRQMPA